MTSQQTSSSRTKPILHILSHLYLNLFCSTNSNLSCSSSSYRHNLQKKFHKQQKQEQHKKQKQCFSRITFVWNTRVEKESGGLARQTKPLFFNTRTCGGIFLPSAFPLFPWNSPTLALTSKERHWDKHETNSSLQKYARQSKDQITPKPRERRRKKWRHTKNKRVCESVIEGKRERERGREWREKERE